MFKKVVFDIFRGLNKISKFGSVFLIEILIYKKKLTEKHFIFLKFFYIRTAFNIEVYQTY